MLSHTGNDFVIRTRVVKSKFFISDVLDIDNEIHFVPLDSKRIYSRSASHKVLRSPTPANTTSTNCRLDTIGG